MSIQTRVSILLGILLVLAGWDDWRRAYAPAAAPAPVLQVTAAAQAAPQTRTKEHDKRRTELKCADGTTFTQTDTQHDTETASAPATASASGAVAPATTNQSAGLGSYAPSNYSVTVTTNPLRLHDVGASLGIRLGTLPLSVEVGAEMNNGSPEFRTGLRLDL